MWCFTFGVTPKSSKSCHCSWMFIGKAWKTMGLPTIWPPWPWPDAAASSASWRCRRRNLGSPSPGVTWIDIPGSSTGGNIFSAPYFSIYYINNYCIQYTVLYVYIIVYIYIVLYVYTCVCVNDCKLQRWCSKPIILWNVSVLTASNSCLPVTSHMLPLAI